MLKTILFTLSMILCFGALGLAGWVIHDGFWGRGAAQRKQQLKDCDA